MSLICDFEVHISEKCQKHIFGSKRRPKCQLEDKVQENPIIINMQFSKVKTTLLSSDILSPKCKYKVLQIRLLNNQL